MFIKSIKIDDFLSFGNIDIELNPLNILIGVNGSGKSNFIDTIFFLRTLPMDARMGIAKLGSIDTITRHKVPAANNTSSDKFSLEVNLDYPKYSTPLKYEISIRKTGERGEYEIFEESLSGYYKEEEPEPFYYFKVKEWDKFISYYDTESQKSRIRELKYDELDSSQSILSKIRGEGEYPIITWLSKELLNIKIYNNWTFGRNAAFKIMGCKTDEDNTNLYEDFSNLPLVLNHLQVKGEIKKFEKYLNEFYPWFGRISVSIDSGLAKIVFWDKGFNVPIPASKLSDGTIRFISLLTILLNPNPPSLICIEEPELGIHPDAISIIAELLKDASRKTQLIITTHSDYLVDQFTDIPESVLIFDKDKNAGTTIKRLNKEELSLWLEDYKLGQAWLSGAFGGTRW